MKDRSDSQRAKAASMMPGVATSRSKLGMEMTNPAPQPSARHVSPGPADRYQRPGALMSSQRMAYANGGKVAKKAEKAEERKEVRSDLKQDRRMMAQMLRADERKDKKMMAGMVHKHEGHLHKGQPRTKLKNGGRVKAKVDNKEAIEFTGPELDEMERDSLTGPGGRGRAAGKAFINQMDKGKSYNAANDAAYVVRGFTDGEPMYPRNKSHRTPNDEESQRTGREKAFKCGGRVKKAAGGAAKIRKGMAKPVPKMPHGGNPTY